MLKDHNDYHSENVDVLSKHDGSHTKIQLQFTVPFNHLYITFTQD